MQPLVYTVCGFGFVGLISLIYAAFKAPEAFEDESGFHLLDPAQAERFEGLPHATLTEGDVVFFR